MGTHTQSAAPICRAAPAFVNLKYRTDSVQPAKVGALNAIGELAAGFEFSDAAVYGLGYLRYLFA